MKVSVLEVAGYNWAMIGLALNKKQDPGHVAESVAPRLAGKDHGHDKFLRQIVIWLDVTAPRFWWQEFDTYKVGVVANGEGEIEADEIEDGEIITQSESTMNSLTSRLLNQGDFENPIPDDWLDHLNYELESVKRGTLALDDFKSHLPEGFLQRRIVTLNYAAMQNIALTRKTHRLPQWRYFIKVVGRELPNPHLIPALGIQ